MAADRDLSADVQAEIEAGKCKPFFLFEAEYYDADHDATAYLRRFTGVGTISWDGKTWLGGGDILGIPSWKETVGLEAGGFSIPISGLSQTQIARVLVSFQRNRPGVLYLGFFNQTTGTVIGDPYAKLGLFERAPITRTVDDNGEASHVIELQYRDHYSDLDRPREKWWTPEEQAALLASDTGFDQVHELQDGLDMFGGFPSTIPGVGSGPGGAGHNLGGYSK